MARFQTKYAGNLDYQIANAKGAAEWVTASQGASHITVGINLIPLSMALKDLGLETFRDTALARAINRGLAKFNSAAHKQLKIDTKIRVPGRLKKGVTIQPAHSGAGGLVGRYIIRDRNIRITKRYFGAHYNTRTPGRPGGLARWGKGFTPAGAQWTSWDGARMGKKTFMIAGSAPVFIRLNGSKRKPIIPVWGPNPAQMIRLKFPIYRAILKEAVGAEFERQITLAYQNAEKKVKARYGL